MEFNLADLFESVADAVPEREAVVCGDNRLTYAQLDERATRLAHHLRASGVGEGDHVGFYLYNCAEYLEGTLAAFKIRAVPININYRYVEEELLYLFDNADLTAAIHHKEFAPRIGAIAEKLPKLLGTDSSTLFLSTSCIRQNEVTDISSGRKEIGESLEGIVTGGTEEIVASRVVEKLAKNISGLTKGLERLTKSPGPIARLTQQVNNLQQDLAQIKGEVTEHVVPDTKRN